MVMLALSAVTQVPMNGLRGCASWDMVQASGRAATVTIQVNRGDREPYWKGFSNLALSRLAPIRISQLDADPPGDMQGLRNGRRRLGRCPDKKTKRSAAVTADAHFEMSRRRRRAIGLRIPGRQVDEQIQYPVASLEIQLGHSMARSG